MMEYAKMERLNARLPPPEEVARAFREFCTYKHEQKEAIEDTQAQYALQAFRYLQKQDDAAGGSVQASKPLVHDTTLRMALQACTSLPSKPSVAHKTFASELYGEAVNRLCAGHAKSRFHSWYQRPYIGILCKTGESLRARNLLLGGEGLPSAVEDQSPTTARLSGTEQVDVHGSQYVQWGCILQGFSDEGNEEELLRSIELMQTKPTRASGSFVARTMVRFYAARGAKTPTEEWFQVWKHAGASEKEPQDLAKRQFSDAVTYEAILRLCLRTRDIEWGQEIVRDIMTTNPPKRLWDTIFEWAVGTGKGVDEIERMMNVMERSNAEITDRTQWRMPDVDTINRLVEYAISCKDPYMAERFIALGRRRNIQPSVTTYVLQMNYRLSVNDVDGALTAYKDLQALDIPGNEDGAVVNRLITAMCRSRRQDFDTIMNVAADLSDRQVRFEPDTVSALSLLHLQRDELHDVVDLLHAHAYHYSSEQRAAVRDVFVEFCMNPANSTTRAWDAYNILKQVFDETDRDVRTKIMVEFFRRRRADMAVHVFNSMRTHTRADTISTTDTYVAGFVGIASLKDEESLEAVHNQLKLDYSIEMDTRLYNALMLAHTACDQPRKALDFWDSIVASREGPTFNSIHLALRACEAAPFGDEEARSIWNRLRRMDVEVDQAMWASYIGACAGNGDVQGTIKKVQEMEADGGTVDAFLIGSFFNAIASQPKQEEAEVWAKENHPEQWAELEKIGMVTRRDGSRYFKIDRSISP
ncbi:hypothetical protein LTR66_014092 [Elasticomyces elasticus]|nr:hypothetical protein LTR66_014092 [Elasticomyces elasticus]